MPVKNILFFFLPICIFLFSTCGKIQERHAIPVLPDSLSSIILPEHEPVLPEWGQENTVVFTLNSEPDNLHPSNGMTSARQLIFQYTQKRLIGLDPATLSLVPELVCEMPRVSGDHLSLTFRLRQDIEWDNGDLLSVEDVVFTFKANKCVLVNNAAYKASLENIKDIVPDKKDPLIFTVKMRKKYLHNIGLFTDFPIMQRSFFDPDNVVSKFTFRDIENVEAAHTSPADLKVWAERFNHPSYGFDPALLNGSGPYKVISWQQGQELVLLKKQKDPASSPGTGCVLQKAGSISHVDKIIFRINTDANAQLLEFKKGITDGSASLSSQMLKQLAEDARFRKNYHFISVQDFSYSYLAFNMKNDKKMFADKLTRKALAYLTPVDEINKIIYNGEGTRMTSSVFPSSMEYNPSLQPIPLDIEKGIKLLKEAGWNDTDGDGVLDRPANGKKTPFIVDLLFINLPDLKNLVLLVAESYRKAQIKVRLIPLESNVFVQKVHDHQFDMMLASWKRDCFPEDFSQVWHSKSWYNGGSNFTGFGNARSDALIDSINELMTDEERIALSRRFQQLIYEEQPYIFLVQRTNRVVVHKRFGNVMITKLWPGIMIDQWKLRKN